MPRSRSRDRRRSRSRSKDRRREKRRDKSHSRDRHEKKDRYESKSRRSRDRSVERKKHRDRSKEHRRRDRSYSKEKIKDSRNNKHETSSSRSKKHRRSSSSDHQKINNTKQETTQSPSGSQMDVKLDSIQMPEDPRRTFEIANEFSREGFEQFSRENGIDFSNIETEGDRETVHEKMEELLKAHFAAQGKIYPPPKHEKPAINAATGFANDGSFLEQFKKMQDEYKQQQEAEKKRIAAEERLKSLPLRRRGGKILKTGVVAKTKSSEEGSEVPADPWSLYLKEVQKYKNASCDSDSKTRPLVK